MGFAKFPLKCVKMISDKRNDWVETDVDYVDVRFSFDFAQSNDKFCYRSMPKTVISRLLEAILSAKVFSYIL
jgi:hypothetical protein